MSDSYKHSYIVGENLLNSLSVYNVGYQKCDPEYQWETGSERSLLHPPYFLGKWFLYDRRKADPVKRGRYVYPVSGSGSAVLCGPGEAVGIWLGRFYGN